MRLVIWVALALTVSCANTSPPEVTPATEDAETENLPAPFTPEQIRDAFVPGLVVTWAFDAKASKTWQRWTVTKADQTHVTISFEDIDVDASPLIALDAGSGITSAVGHTLKYDVRDSIFDPHEGYVLRFEQDIAEIGRAHV